MHMSTVNAVATDLTTASGMEPSGMERRARLHGTIESLVKLRQEVIVSYCQLSGVSSFARRDVETPSVDADQLRRFCQIMVDYTAMGHFEVYQRIIEGKERRVAVKAVAAEVYPAIAETTDYLVDFNDKYDAFEGTVEDVEMLTADLSRLGEIIAIRGELEDQILAALRQ
jgi:regulator of sigma D